MPVYKLVIFYKVLFKLHLEGKEAGHASMEEVQVSKMLVLVKILSRIATVSSKLRWIHSSIVLIVQ
jgi:hypothetical protein